MVNFKLILSNVIVALLSACGAYWIFKNSSNSFWLTGEAYGDFKLNIGLNNFDNRESYLITKEKNFIKWIDDYIKLHDDIVSNRREKRLAHCDIGHGLGMYH
jgi:hypothetical protein